MCFFNSESHDRWHDDRLASFSGVEGIWEPKTKRICHTLSLIIPVHTRAVFVSSIDTQRSIRRSNYSGGYLRKIFIFRRCRNGNQIHQLATNAHTINLDDLEIRYSCGYTHSTHVWDWPNDREACVCVLEHVNETNVRNSRHLFGGNWAHEYSLGIPHCRALKRHNRKKAQNAHPLSGRTYAAQSFQCQICHALCA